MIDISLDEPTGDFWIDNGIVSLYELLGEGEYELEEALIRLSSRLIEKTGNVGYYYDIDEGKLKTYELENWKYPTNYFIKVVPQPDKVIFSWDDCDESDGKLLCVGIRKSTNNEASLELPRDVVDVIDKRYAKNGKIELFLEPPRRQLDISVSKKKGICNICGTEDYLVKGKQWMYPFIVDPSKFGNFYSQSRGMVNLCPRCALAGLAAYTKWIYVVEGKDYMHFFVFHSDLRTLRDLYEGVLNPIFLENEGNKGRNFTLKFHGRYAHETTMGLVLTLFERLKTREGVDSELAEMFNEFIEESRGELHLYVASGRLGNAFNMSGLVEFSRFSALYRLYNLWIDAVKGIYEGAIPLKIIPSVFSQFIVRVGDRTETTIRDKVCWKVLNFEDPFPHVEEYLYDPKGSRLRAGTLQVFEVYAKEVLNVDEKHIKMLAAFGHEIGRASAQRGTMDVLYSLRNAKNLDEFLKVLSDINFKLGLTVNEDLLKVDRDKVLGVPWVRVKTLLSIYAMNEYLSHKKESGGGSK